MKIRIVANEMVTEAYLAVPPGHQHLRCFLKVGGEWLLFSEATLANLVRAFVTVKTHPQTEAVHLLKQSPKNRKKGFAEHQLLESKETQEEIMDQLTVLWQAAEQQGFKK